MSLWDKLKPKVQTAMTYTARMVLLDSDVTISESKPVETRQFDYVKRVRQ
jgi:hypothetical protein